MAMSCKFATAKYDSSCRLIMPCSSAAATHHCGDAAPRHTRTGAHHHRRAMAVAVAMVKMLLLSSLLVPMLNMASSGVEASSEEELQGYNCSGSGSGLASRFGMLEDGLYNRASVALYSLSQDLDSTGYGVSVMYQCRGDLDLSECPTCVRNAFGFVAQNCSDPSFAQVELKGCGVVFSDQRIYEGSYNFVGWLYNVNNGSSAFLKNRDKAMANVTEQAIANKQKLGTYWAVDVVGNGTEDVCYALAQCHGYLPPSNCTYCLSLATAEIKAVAESLGQRIFFGSCYVRYEAAIFYNADHSPTLLTSLGPPPAAPSPSPLSPISPYSDRSLPASAVPGVTNEQFSSKNSFGLGFLVTMVVVFSSLFCVVGSLIGWFSHRARVHRNQVSNQSELGKSSGSMKLTRDYIDQASIEHFSLAQLEKATNNFALENKIGEGGYGVVYQGVLEDGVMVAVKKLINSRRHSKERFLNEVKLIKSLQHRNLVKIIGCCVGGDNSSRFLVYEYLPNLSLDHHLFSSDGRSILNWNKRREILEGVARGLTYLHHDSHLRIVHRDIKAANILLDCDLNPKIADFGLAKLFPLTDQTHMSTRIAGTFGYIAPEYAVNGQVSTKSDVFGFGLLMLEVISGRRIVEESSPLGQQYLLHWAWRLHQEERELEILDEAIQMQHDYIEEEVKRFIHVSLLCCQTSPSQRPSMVAVLEMLLNVSCDLDIPTMPTYITSKDVSSHRDD